MRPGEIYRGITGEGSLTGVEKRVPPLTYSIGHMTYKVGRLEIVGDTRFSSLSLTATTYPL